ncbi:MAG TPA: hypothetical protein VKR31_10205 [Rhizomicrobium sp.]|nr:hypothetical protein [Rhizomicrobium sp.]
MSGRDELYKEWCEQMDASIMKIFGGGCTAARLSPDDTLTLEKFTRLAVEWTARAKRESITFVVIDGHSGPALRTEHPSNGTRIELSYAQACEVHKHWPMKLSEVIAPDMAEFVPVSGVFNELFAVTLPAPPYVQNPCSPATDDDEPLDAKQQNGA